MKRATFSLVAVLAAACASAQTTSRDKCDAPSEYNVIEQCGWAENDKLESQLRASYASVVAVLKPKPVDLLKLARSQKAWMTYREESCGLWATRVQYQVPWCRVTLTSARIKELVHVRECEQEGGGKC